MHAPTPRPITREQFNAATLAREHPPRWQLPNKQLIYRLACPEGARHGGTLTYSRWRAVSLVGLASPLRAASVLTPRRGVFAYPPARTGETQWHVNFAHSDLFSAYGGPALAQDELQVVEHPVLASLREALVARGVSTRTVEDGAPTPVLITGVERRCAVATGVDPDAGRPLGIYGRRFARAERSVVEAATRRLESPTITNILAMEAPAFGRGRYVDDEIRRVLETAITGLAAARSASEGACVVHTGFWGCGAYGGDRTLMTLLQIVAAAVAGTDRLEFYTVDSAGAGHVAGARAVLESLLGSLAAPGVGVPLDDLIGALAAMGFEWGVGDGS